MSSITTKESTQDQNFIFTCLKCDYKNNDPESYRLHAISHISEFFRCEVCFFETNCKEVFTLHQNEHSLKDQTNSRQNTVNVPPNTKAFQTNPKPKLKCNNCSFQTNSKGSLKLHSFIHKQQTFSCSVCDFKTNFEKLLEMHEEIHAKTNLENRLACNYCLFVTTRERLLQKHLRKHTGQEKCLLCNFSPANESELRDHQCDESGRSNGKKCEIKCIVCGFKTFNRNVFSQHMNIHLSYESEYSGKMPPNNQKNSGTMPPNSQKISGKMPPNNQKNKNLDTRKKNIKWSSNEKREIYWCYYFARHDIFFGKHGALQRQTNMLKCRRIIDFEKISQLHPKKVASVAVYLKFGRTKLMPRELEEIKLDVDNFVRTHLQKISPNAEIN